MTIKLSNLLSVLLAVGGLDSVNTGQILTPGFAKIAPWCLARRESFQDKAPGLVSADGATNVYSLNRRAVSSKHLHYRDWYTFWRFYSK
jgi:hypothetical protein